MKQQTGPGPLTRQQSNQLLPHQGQGQHRRAHTLLTSIDGQHESRSRSSDAFGLSTKDLFSGFDKIYGDVDNDSKDVIDDIIDDDNHALNDFITDEKKIDDDNNPSETLPLLHGDASLGNAPISERQLNRARKVLTNSHWKGIRESIQQC
jgi:hypothetical protein